LKFPAWWEFRVDKKGVVTGGGGKGSDSKVMVE